MAKDSDYTRMIHSGRWQRLRRWKLNGHPLCERCAREGFVSAAEEVHHVRPVEWGATYADKERLMFDPGNLEALCRRCHVEAHTELGRSGRERARKVNAEQTKAIIRKFYGEEI